MKFYMTGQWQSLNTVDCLIEVIQKGMFDSIFILHVDLSTVRFLLRTPPPLYLCLKYICTTLKPETISVRGVHCHFYNFI
jgi:hypothetical protein